MTHDQKGRAFGSRRELPWGIWMRTTEALGLMQQARSIVAEYRRLTPRSAAMFERGRQSLVGGTTGNLRFFSPYPLYFRTGEGAELTDVDGRLLIDCFLCNGPMLLGHRHPSVMESLRRTREVGSLVVNPELAVDVAEAIQRAVPCAQRVRLLNSGTEAVLAAVRIARAHSGKPKIVKFFGHYHGQDDQFLVGLDPSGNTVGAGIPAETFANILQVRYGDVAALEAVLKGRQDVAAVMLDPAMHAGGLWGSSSDFLREVRELTHRRNVLLIFDEVITGFRLARGGAQGFHGVTPDLATFAKALGAGEKLAAVAGREDVMSVVDPTRSAAGSAAFQSGTGNDGTSALAAGVAALDEYERLDRAGAYGRLNDLGSALARGFRNAFSRRGVPHHVNQLGSMLQLFLTDQPPSFESYASLRPDAVALLYLALINEGVLLSLPTSNHIYLSFAHTATHLDRILSAVDRVLARYDFGELAGAAQSSAR